MDVEFICFDASGNILCDLTTQLSNVKDIITIPATQQGTVSGSATHATFAGQRLFYAVAGGTWEYDSLTSKRGNLMVCLNMFTVTMSLSGDTVAWSVTNNYGGNASTPMHIFYGVY